MPNGCLFFEKKSKKFSQGIKIQFIYDLIGQWKMIYFELLLHLKKKNYIFAV